MVPLVGVLWTVSNKVTSLIEKWRFGFSSFRGFILWTLMILPVLWSIWLQCNRTFWSKSSSSHVVSTKGTGTDYIMGIAA